MLTALHHKLFLARIQNKNEFIFSDAMCKALETKAPSPLALHHVLSVKGNRCVW
jgi:hypothetical protein